MKTLLGVLVTTAWALSPLALGSSEGLQHQHEAGVERKRAPGSHA